MLLDKQIIIVKTHTAFTKSQSYKFIGANDDGKWDFTPLVSEYVNYKTNRDFNDNIISIRGYDGTELVRKVLVKLKEEGIESIDLTGDNLYFRLRGLLCFFHI